MLAVERARNRAAEEGCGGLEKSIPPSEYHEQTEGLGATSEYTFDHSGINVDRSCRCSPPEDFR